MSEFLFLSTLSLRRATANAVDQILPGHISIHALLAESDVQVVIIVMHTLISIHALLAESDPPYNLMIHHAKKFLSTLSLRRATSASIARPYVTGDFYPRSPCGERLCVGQRCNLTIQFLSTLSLRRATYFLLSLDARLSISIHALLAESDRPVHVTSSQIIEFLSTLSLRRATRDRSGYMIAVLISIHALLAESDRRRAGLAAP